MVAGREPDRFQPLFRGEPRKALGNECRWNRGDRHQQSELEHPSRDNTGPDIPLAWRPMSSSQ